MESRHGWQRSLPSILEPLLHLEGRLRALLGHCTSAWRDSATSSWPGWLKVCSAVGGIAKYECRKREERE
jgi:hypothetical protein